MSEVWNGGLPLVTWRNLFMLVDNGRASPGAYLTPEGELVKLGQCYGKNLGCLVVIPAEASQPPEEARRAINDAWERQAASIKGVAWVVEGRGFQSAVVRATLTTMGLVRRKLQTWKVVDNVEEGLGWLATRVTMSGDVDLQEAVRVLAEARAAQALVEAPSTPAIKPKSARRWAWSTNGHP